MIAKEISCNSFFLTSLDFFRETENDLVMERVNADGEVLGFSGLNVSRQQKDHPLTAVLR